MKTVEAQALACCLGNTVTCRRPEKTIHWYLNRKADDVSACISQMQPILIGGESLNPVFHIPSDIEEKTRLSNRNWHRINTGFFFHR